MKSPEEIVRRLPAELQEEVREFAESLLAKRSRAEGRKLRLSWAGGLREFREKYTSLALQQQALGWWGT